MPKVRPISQDDKSKSVKWKVSNNDALTEENDLLWHDLPTAEKAYRVALTTLKVAAFLLIIFSIICTFALLADAFQLIGGTGMGQKLKNSPFLSNQISSAIFGMVITLVLQSGSTLISVLVGMVAGDLLTVHQAIPIMIGAEMGASLINALVSLGQSGDRNQFRRAFAAATMNDVFNLMNFVTVLPLEMTTGFMEWLSGILVQPLSKFKGGEVKTLQYLTDPILNLIVQIDEDALTRVTALSRSNKNVTYDRDTFIFRCVDLQTKEELVFYHFLCSPTYFNRIVRFFFLVNGCFAGPRPLSLPSISLLATVRSGPYNHIFTYSTWSDSTVGIVLLVAAIIILGLCLTALVQIIQSLLAGKAAIWVRKLLEKKIPPPFRWLTGYFVMVVAAFVVVIVQSSSVFRSALTPLVGVGVIPLKRLYPLLLGANVGTTSTGVLAALSADPSQLQETLQIALCQTLYNLLGVFFFYPIPFLKKIPLTLCMKLGDITARYRWFALGYILNVFFLFPLFLLGLSFLPSAVMFSVVGVIITMIVFIATINYLQEHRAALLPCFLYDWSWLPRFLWDLEYYDKIFRSWSEHCLCCPSRFFNASMEDQEGSIRRNSTNSDNRRNSSEIGVRAGIGAIWPFVDSTLKPPVQNESLDQVPQRFRQTIV